MSREIQLLKEVQVLVGKHSITSRSEALFSHDAIAFLEAIANYLENESHPRSLEILNFTAWIRSNANHWLQLSANKEFQGRRGLGIIFHVPASNLPMGFMYSFVTGLLTGNSNIVRVPTSALIESEIVLRALKKLFKRSEFKELSRANAFVYYESNFEISENISEVVDARMVWGSDQTCEEFSKMKTKAKCQNLYFSNRIAAYVFHEQELGLIKDNPKLQHGLLRDIFTYSQNSCMAPRVVAWVGEVNLEERVEFWQSFGKFLKSRNLNEGEEMYFGRYAILEGFQSSSIQDSFLVEDTNFIVFNGDILVEPRPNLEILKNGMLLDVTVNTFEQFLRSFPEVQVFGFMQSGLMQDMIMGDAGRIKNLMRAYVIGKSLAFDLNWDGKDLLNLLSFKEKNG